MKDALKYDDGIWFYPFMLSLLLWFVKIVEIRFDYYFVDYGVLPRTFKGLQGVVLSPFIHADYKHLWTNTIPFFVTNALLYYFYRKLYWSLLLLGVLSSGLLTWFIARESYHIGASGLIYFNVSFLFFGGVFSKNFRLMAVALLIIFLYGGMIWYVFPIEKHISWEGHLAGLVSGLVLAFVYKAKMLPKEKKYQWEQEHYNPELDEFMQSFDENGNFIDPPEPVIDAEPDAEEESENSIKINYIFRKTDKEV